VAGTIKITADTAKAESDIKRLQTVIGGFESVSSKAAKALGLITAAAGALGFAVSKTLDVTGALVDAADNLNMSAQSLQAMQHAASMTGISAEELNGVLYKLQKNIGEALVDGSGAGYDALEKLNIPIQELATMRPDEQYKLIAKSLAEIENPVVRASTAMALFGKQGQKVLTMAENIAQAEKEMKRLGLALSDTDVAGLDMAGDSIQELKNIVSQGLQKAFADLAPYIIAAVEYIKDAIESAGGFEGVMKKVRIAFQEIANIIAITAFVFVFTTMARYALILVTALGSATKAMALFNAVVMRNPLMLAVGAALLLAKVLGFDVTKHIGEFMGLQGGVATAQDKITDKAKKTAEELKKKIPVYDELNKKQKEALKQFDEAIIKLQDELRLEKEKIGLSEAEANANKMIAEQTRKLAEAKLAISDDQKQKIKDVYVELAAQKEITAEYNKQQARLKDLADSTSGPLTQAVKDYTAAMAAANKEAAGNQGAKVTTLPGMPYENGQNINIAEQTKARKAQLVAGRILIGELRMLEDERAGREFQIETNLLKAKMDLDEAYYANKALLDSSGFDLEKANAKLREDMIIAGWNLKFELDAKEDERTAQKYARMAIYEDEYYMNSIAGAKAVFEAKRNYAAFEQKTAFEQTAFAIDQGAQMFTALGAHNKQAFETAKKFNIANAIMNTYMAATKALASYPPPFSFIAAAAAIGMGLAQVAQIKSQTYSGRALGGPVMGGKSYIVGENGPELFSPQGTGTITRNSDLMSSEPININFNIQANDAQGFDELLTQRRSMVTQMVRDAMQEQGQRSRM
jgi:hypothetical protein